MKKRLSVARYSPGRRPYTSHFTVDMPDGSTVLDALNHIRWYKDGTLAFRRSCRSGICGSCAMNVAGRNALACETQLSSLPEAFAVEPLTGFAAVKDLVVDLTPLYRAFGAVKPYLIPRVPPPEENGRRREYRQSEEQHLAFDEAAQCIVCGSCTASCPSFWADKSYLGPAALYKACRFLTDNRDGGFAERADAIDCESGAWRCHDIFNCTVSCPKNLNPGHGTQVVKRHLAVGKIRKLLGFK